MHQLLNPQESSFWCQVNQQWIVYWKPLAGGFLYVLWLPEIILNTSSDIQMTQLAMDIKH